MKTQASADLKNLKPVDATNPYGAPKNRSEVGATDGTVFNEDYMNDAFQMHQRALADSGITPNELLDNADNGFQLFEAMFGTPWKEVGNDGGATSYVNGATSSTGAYAGGKTLRYRKTRGGSYIHLEGWVGLFSVPDNNPIFTLPVGYRPDQSLRYPITLNDGSLGTFSLLSTGEFSTDLFGGASGYVNIEIPLP